MGEPLPAAGAAPRLPSALEFDSAIGKSFLEAVTAATDAALSDSPHCLNPKLLRDSRIKTLLGDLSDVDKIPAELARMYSHSLCVATLAVIAGNRLMARNCAERRPIAPLPKWRLARVNQYIDAHMEEGIRLADLAKAAGLTKMHFAAQFRASVGMCPHEYLLRQRIRRAQALLQDSGQRLVDVALSVGFQAQSHFTTVFRRYVGDSPHRWRLSQSANDDANICDLSHGESALC
jgi:AraC-like DNA-binding protein